MGDQELPTTAGALGNEKPKRRSRRRRQSGDEGGGKDRRKRARKETEIVTNKPSTRNVRPAFEEAPKPASENLCGRPAIYINSDVAVKKKSVKVASPYHTGNLNTESFLHFVIHSNSVEWIRFNKHSLSLVLFMLYPNPNRVAGGNAEQQAENHATRALTGTPQIFIDPDVMGNGFFTRGEIVINNLPVATNSANYDHWLHYCRSNRVFNAKNKDPHFIGDSQFVFAANAAGVADLNEAMKKGLRGLDYGTWNSRTGVRIPVYLDGIFPFDLKCEIIQALENRKPEKLYMPPNTHIEIKLYYHRAKIEAMWHGELTMANYFNPAEQIQAPPVMTMQIQEAHLTYESVELHPAQQIALMKDFMAPNACGWFDYDIIRSQHQGLTGGVASTDNTFQIMPHARLMIILFLMDWSTFVIENRRRPLTGWSRFPANCSKIKIDYAGNDELVCKSYDRFGVPGEDNQWSKQAWYDYMVENRFTSAKFEDFFPKNANARSFIQAFVFDVRNQMSHQTQLLQLHMEFAAGQVSPTNMQINVLTVHPNGKAVIRNVGTSMYDWEWEYMQPL